MTKLLSWLVIALLVAQANLALAADTNLTALTATTTVVGTDLAYVVVDPGGTPLSRKITIANLFTNPIFTTSINVLDGTSNGGLITFGTATNHQFGAVGTGAGTEGFYWQDRNADSATSIGGNYNAINLATAGALLFVWRTGATRRASIGVGGQILSYSAFTDASNYERASLSHVTGTGAVLAAETAGTGGDNLDVTLTPAGTGLVQFGTHSAIASETVTGFITIKDSGGTSRKIAVVGP